MRAPDIPSDDARRVEALRALGLLDTLPEQRFNRITRTAARMFNVEMALVSLVDKHRQWFKSRVGLHAIETPRAISFCAHAILSDEILVVEDAKSDFRFRDNPMVIDTPHVRFYAGRPIRAPGGERIGTLCVLDSDRRHFDAEDQRALDDLGDWTEIEIARDNGYATAAQVANAALATLGEPMLIVGPSGRIKALNAAVTALLGYDGADLVGEEISVVLPDTGKGSYFGTIAGAKSLPAEVDWNAARKRGSAMPVSTRFAGFPMRGERGYAITLRVKK